MASFTPTLRIVTTAGQLAQTGRSVDEATTTLREIFAPISIRKGIELSVDYVQSVETSEVVTDFSATVVGRFTAVGVPHLILSTGDVVALTIELI
jgi:hypothetical protein